jgi:hypothetical protein
LSLKDGFGNSLIRATATEISAHTLANTFGIVARLVFLNETDSTHDLARCAEAALQTIMGDESLLHRMQPIALRYALDRQDLSAVVTDRKRKARIDPSSVDEDRASAALPAVTAFFGSRQMKALAKKIEDGHTWVIQLDGPSDTVYGKRRRKAHAVLHMSDGEARPSIKGRRICRLPALAEVIT